MPKLFEDKIRNLAQHTQLRFDLRRYLDRLQSIDAHFLQATQHDDITVFCHRGCHDCCLGLFEVSILDILLLAFYAPDSVFAADIHIRAKEQSRELEACGWPFPHRIADQPENMETSDFFSRFDQTPCLFLSDKGTCLAYDYRPSICRFQGLPFKDPVSKLILADQCPLHAPDRNPVPFDFIGFDRHELKIFKHFQTFSPDGLHGHVSDFDMPIVSAILLRSPNSQQATRVST